MVNLLFRILFVFLWLTIIVAALLILFYRYYFLRRPRRKSVPGRAVVSPANGRIARIIGIDKHTKRMLMNKGLFGRINLLVKDVVRQGYLIVIVMTPFDVHYQRSPVDGTVERTMYRKGKFINAVKDASSLKALRNEKNEIVIRHARIGRVKVVQVAGALARRIRCFVKPKQKIHKGEEIGLICLGSQVILVIPKLKLRVKEGQKVIDGKTIIARF